jgi:ArsR family transcriptional regulator
MSSDSQFVTKNGRCSGNCRNLSRRHDSGYNRPSLQTTMAQTQVHLMFKAFSDRTRLRILHLLLEGELCVGDLVTVLHVPQPTASRHLAYLRKAGLVATRKTGQWNYYKLAKADSSFHHRLMECLKGCFQAVPEIRNDAKKIAKLRSSGGCCPK